MQRNIHWELKIHKIMKDRLGGVMVSMLASSVEGCGFDPWLGQTKEIKIGICCFSAK